MSLLDRVRRAPVKGAPPDELADGSLRLGSALAGGAAALVSMLIIALPVLVAWVSSPQSTVDWARALKVGACAWLLANGASLSSGSATISLTPMVLTAVPLVVATIAVRRIVRQLGDHGPRRFSGSGVLPRVVAEVAVTFAASYAATGLVVALACSSGPLHPSLWGSLLGTTVVGAVSVLAALGLELRGQVGSVAPDLHRVLEARVPVHLRRAIRPGLWGAVAIFGAGLALTLAMVALNLGRIGALYQALNADPVGVVMLSLGQLMVLPNVALWVASWMAGPGFGLGDGTAVTWLSSDPGLLPLIPGLGAVPAPGPLPAGLWLSALVPVAAGALVGWRALRAVTRLSSWQAKAETAASACVVAAVVLTAASALAGGSVGAARLSGLGAPSLMFGGSVLAELLLGAGVVVLVSHLRAFRS